MNKALFVPSAFQNFEEFSRYIAPHISPDDKIITHSLESFPAKFAAKNRINLEVIFGKKGEENMAFNRAKSIIDAADQVIVFTDLESSMSLYEIDATLNKGRPLIIKYFGIPVEENAKAVNFANLGNAWLRDDFPCEISYREVEYSSVKSAMNAIRIMAAKNLTSDGDYKNEEWLATLPKLHRDRLLKIMFELQSQKFGNANAELRRKMELQKGEIALKGVDFWTKYLNLMFKKIKTNEIHAS